MAAKTKKTKQFTLSKALRAKLPESERENADQVLIAKATGLCALCNRPLGQDPDLITADHRIAGGKNTLGNLYLAHKSCNSSRKDLDFDKARPLVEFKAFCDEKGSVTFDDVLSNYVTPSNRQFRYAIKGNRIQLQFAGSTQDLPVYIDPASMTQYCFAEVPVSHILNDTEVQPRLIIYSHVRRLALDFYERPVHEPSNCRLEDVGPGLAELRQFDGQHKTTAQILINRTAVPTKIYIKPLISMLQNLVVKIQQEIKKQPLTRSDTLAKLGDVIKSLLDSYVEKGDRPRTEKGFIEAQPQEKRNQVKNLYFDELARMVYFDPDNEMRDWVKPGSAHAPTTDKVVIDKIISPLLYTQLLEIDMDTEGGRDSERSLILLILNTITRKMLPADWFKDTNALQRTRTQNFFYQGSIGWWITELLIPTLRYILVRIGDKKPLLIDAVTPESEGRIIEAVEAVCDLDVWSTEDQHHLKAMRSNTIQNVKDAFPKITAESVIKSITRGS